MRSLFAFYLALIAPLLATFAATASPVKTVAAAAEEFSSSAISDLHHVLQLAETRKLYLERQWRKLLHFEPGLIGPLAGQVDSKDFYFAPDGDSNLKSELNATLRAFWQAPVSPEEDIPQCRFPARYQFFKNHLATEIKNWPDRECPRFLKYAKALKGESLSLVFSSFYLNNPSSAFGHTFLRINKAPAQNGRRFELLDYGINYAAMKDTDNALIYAIKGLFGMFPGNFTSVPYYYKVREYNNAESRDLWEYELNVKPEQVDMMVAHIWELGPARIDYWYLTENCAYHMLTILEAAAPNVDVVDSLHKWIIPSDTVKAAWQTPGLVKSFHYRPSVRTEFFFRMKDLHPNEQAELQQMIASRSISDDFAKFSLSEQQRVLDAAIDYVDFKFPHDMGQPGPESEFKARLLRARSQIEAVTPKLEIPLPVNEQPHLGHGSYRLSVGARGSQEGADAALFGLKFSLHDSLDLITGYPEYAGITFGDFQFSHGPDGKGEDAKTRLEDFTVFAVTSHMPRTLFAEALSWQIKLSMERTKDLNCAGCLAATFGGGAGYTFQLARSPFSTMFLGLLGGVYHTTENGEKLRAALGPALKVRLRWTERSISTLEGSYKRVAEGEIDTFDEAIFSHQYSFDSHWAAKLALSHLSYDKRAQLELLYFY